MDKKIGASIIEILQRMGADEKTAGIIKGIIIFIVILIIAYLANFIAKKIIQHIIARVIKKTKTEFDDILLKHKVFTKISHIVPALIIYFSVGIAFEENPWLVSFIQGATYIYMILVVTLVLDSFLNAVMEIYSTFKISQKIPIKGYVQVIKIIIYFFSIIFILSVILGKSPGYFFAGLGAVAAILLLVFKDTILGFVASIQLSAYDMVKPGDWVEMPSENADGDVIDISISTVKIQNFDRTITTIPTYNLVSKPFKNWKGMKQSGGRRIKRSVFLDMGSIKFCTEEMIEKFSKIAVLKDYIASKKEELDKYNKEHNIDRSSPANGRAMTNIGTFRKYLELYLKNHPMINQDMTLLVRQLAPSEKGVAIEIYVFCKDKVWGNYEAIQADIFDHIFAVIPVFELKVFQSPSGADFSNVLNAHVD